MLVEDFFLEVSLLHQWRQLLIFLCFPLPLHFIIGWCDFERCPSLAIIHPSCDEAALPCLMSTPCIMWYCRSVFLLEKAQSLLICHLEPSRTHTISRDDGEGGMHVLRCRRWRWFSQYRKMMGRVGCTFAALLKIVLAFKTVEVGIAVVMVLLFQLLCCVSCLYCFSCLLCFLVFHDATHI